MIRRSTALFRLQMDPKGKQHMAATIAYVDHAKQTGGAEKSLVELIAHLDRERFEPVVLHRAGATWAEEARQAGGRLSPTVSETVLYEERRTNLGGGPLSGISRLARAVAPVRAIAGELRALRPALVHTNSTKMHLLAGAAARLRRLPGRSCRTLRRRCTWTTMCDGWDSGTMCRTFCG